MATKKKKTPAKKKKSIYSLLEDCRQGIDEINERNDYLKDVLDNCKASLAKAEEQMERLNYLEEEVAALADEIKFRDKLIKHYEGVLIEGLGEKHAKTLKKYGIVLGEKRK